jgi:hypothetical protein
LILIKFKFLRLVVCFSIERLIAVYFPLKLITICSRLKTKLAITFLFIFSLSFYSFAYFTTDIDFIEKMNHTTCITSNDWFHFASIMALVDIIIVTLLPFIIITIINIMIAYKIKKQSNLNFISISPIKYKKDSRFSILFINNQRNKNKKESKVCILDHCSTISRKHDIPKKTLNKKQKDSIKIIKKKKEKRQPSLLVSNSSRKYKTEISLCHINNTNLANKSIGRNTVRVNNNTNRTLFLISIVFLILHFPLAVNKSWYFFDGNYNLIEKENIELTSNYSEYFGNDTLMEETDLKQKLTLNEYEEIFERISCYLFYLNFSLNFFLYTSNKSKRKIFLNTLRKRFSF